MGRRTQIDDCGCKAVIFTNKKEPGVETFHVKPCKQHNGLEYFFPTP
jgi:hypothetical protein